MATQDNALSQYYEYSIRPGDTLSGIMARMYGIGPRDSRYATSKEYVLSINPHIKNPNLIRVGDVLRLGEYPDTRRAQVRSVQPEMYSAPAGRPVTEAVHPLDRDYFWALSWLEHNSKALTVPGSVAFGASSYLLSPGNRALMAEVGDLYGQYKGGHLTKGQYDYRRRVALDRLKRNLGPAEKWLFGDKGTHQSIHIARRGGVPATAYIARHAERIGKLAKFARGGGIVLTGVGVTASCMQIANTADQHEKNEIFVETAASTLIGGAAGLAVGLFLISSPVGWGTALVLAVGSTALGYGAGKTAQWAYDRHGRNIDFVSGAGVDHICR